MGDISFELNNSRVHHHEELHHSLPHCQPGKPSQLPRSQAQQQSPQPMHDPGQHCLCVPIQIRGQGVLPVPYANSPTPWCATKVDPNGTVVINNWGDCANTQTSACPVEDLTKPSCTALSGAACVFPFRHLGIVYNKCADVTISGVSDNQAWCSTEVSSAGEHVVGKEGVCPNTCTGAESNTASASTTTTTTTTTPPLQLPPQQQQQQQQQQQ